jgi:hypothetical protein
MAMKDWKKLLETSQSASAMADAGKPEEARQMMEAFQTEGIPEEKDRPTPDMDAEPQTA